MKTPRIALVHDYLNAYGGAESLVNALWEIWPNSPIYTALWDKRAFRGTGAFKGAKVIVPSWAKKRFVNKFYKYFTFSFPLVYESFDLSEFDIVISSSANFAKGVITGPEQLHISYIHTPPRFLYGYPTETSKRDVWYWKPILAPLDSLLRIWDQQASKRPDFLLCNSKEVQSRIKKFYRRNAFIINPFFSIKEEYEKEKAEEGPFYLVLSRMSRYKNVDKAILACSRLGRSLKVAGSGKELEGIKDLARSVSGDIEVLGFVSEKRKVSLLKGCRAVIYLVEHEDFGMAVLEAMHFGKPAIVLNEGGFKETVKDGYNGVVVSEPTTSSLIKGISRFERLLQKVDFKKNCIKSSKGYSKERFQKEIEAYVLGKWERFTGSRS